ncbi:MAG: Gfo/Idh/MocA family oxidoreductase [Anaerolineaceae bacterium]|nr:Gfo/Idh/MocA family oxidoreductase [Anaerolineaceae bacterium]
MSQIRSALIGVGDFGARHLDVLAHAASVDLVAICDIDEERARNLASHYGVRHVFIDWREMLADVRLDALHIVTPDVHHFEPAMAAIQRGVDIFVEKPLCPDVADARTLIDEAERLGRRLQVGHLLRFDAASADVKARIASGQLGRVFSIYGRRNVVRSQIPIYRFANRLYTTSVHDIDLILWFYEGLRPVEVYLKSLSVSGQGDDVFWGIITMEDGSLGVIESNWNLPDATPWRGHCLLEVVGTEGTALAEVPGNSYQVWSERVEVPDTSYWPVVHGTVTGALRDEIMYFVQCVSEGRPLTVLDPEDAYRGLQVARALIRSAEEGRPIRLEEEIE